MTSETPTKEEPDHNAYTPSTGAAKKEETVSYFTAPAPATDKSVTQANSSGTVSYATSSPVNGLTDYKDKDASAPSLSSSAAVEQSKDGMKFVRTGDIKFQVANVTDATYRIEDVTAQYGGFVTYTNLHSSASAPEMIPISADSSLQVTSYTVENNITVRIPNKRLDSALRAMSGLVDFLDYRIITATEVSNQSLANEMTERRNKEYEQRALRQVDTKPMKQEEATAAEDRALQSREAADNARLASLSLSDQIKYSTVHILIYQAQSTRKVKVCNESNISRYRASVTTRLWEAAVSGWEAFEEVVVAVAHLWMFIVLAVVGVLVYRRFRRMK
jgi:hypothetical protein